MAQIDNAVYTAAQGFIFTAPVGEEAPSVEEIQAFNPSLEGNVGNFPNWENIGHTARDELPVSGYEGGETETRGTCQSATLRTATTEPPTDYVTFNVHQFDNDTLALYYGTESASAEQGVYSFDGTVSQGVERALLIVIVDGEYRLGFHAPKVSIRREDSIELAVDEFAYMPLRATLLKDSGSEYVFSWINTYVSGS